MIHGKDFVGHWMPEDEAYQAMLDRKRIAMRHYKREWARAHRPVFVPKPKPPRLVASLHSLRCSGPTKASGCRCRKIKVYG